MSKTSRKKNSAKIELIRKVMKDVEEDVTNEEMIHLILQRQFSKNTEKKDGELTPGQRAADAIARFAGSWTFILLFAGVLFLWVGVNAAALSHAFDPYPFILLNLVLSCVAAIQAPLIMMSQNRQEEKDRRRAENDYIVNLKSEIIVEDLHKKIDELLENQRTLLKTEEKIAKDPAGRPEEKDPGKRAGTLGK